MQTSGFSTTSSAQSDGDRAFVATIPVADRLCILTDHVDAGQVDALRKISIATFPFREGRDRQEAAQPTAC